MFILFYNRFGKKAPGYLLRNLQAGNNQPSSGVSASASRNALKNGAKLGDALVIGDRLRQFNSMMAILGIGIRVVKYIRLHHYAQQVPDWPVLRTTVCLIGGQEEQRRTGQEELH